MKRALSLALGLAACTDARLEIGADPIVLGEGRYRLEVEAGGRALALRRDGALLLSLDAASFELGLVSEIDANKSYDPWEIERRGDAESGVWFTRPREFRATKLDEAHGAIDLDYGDGLVARVTLGVASAARFTLTLEPGAPPAGGPFVALARVRVHTTGDSREGLYGLGEQEDSVDNRGKLRAMQIEPDGAIESSYNEAHVPVPLVVGTRGWAMFVASTRVGVFDVARKSGSAIEATFAAAPLAASEGARAEPLRVELFAADAPLDLFREYYAVTGAPRLPPPWALGPLLWRDESKDQREVEEDIAKIRDLDLATSGIWIDRPYARAVNTFDFDPTKFPDPKAMIDRAHAAGLRLALWSVPYLEPTAEPFASEAKAKGFHPPGGGIALNKWGLPIDFTNQGAWSFWSGLVRRYTDLGVDGFKLDYAEDVVPSIGHQRNVWRFADGTDERTMHHGYSALYHRVYAETLPDAAFLLCRAAHWGEQTSGCVVWPGDMDATFTHHRESFQTRDGSEVTGVGGLPATVVMGLSLAASGFPFFGADTGGYRHSPPDRELFVRWVEQTALSTVMQVGDGSSQPPWVFTPENGRDPAALDLYRTYARLHLRLFPYEWTYAQRMLRDGRPIQRALGLAEPALGVHPSDEYLFGDDLLVAPVVARGQTRRRLVVPKGVWRSFWDGTAHVGDARSEIEVDAPLETLPLFLREGAIVPMLRPSIDTLAPAIDRGVESFADDPGPLWVLVAPGPPRRFELFDGTVIARAEEGAIEVAPGERFTRGFVLELVATPAPHDVVVDDGMTRALAKRSGTILDAAVEGWSWDPARSGTLTIVLPARAARVRVR
jgi:alpha-D-xyloside xylohydrolase